MTETYIVYIKTNASGYVTEANSSGFLEDLTGWQQIDEGQGDTYHHAQSHYFQQPIMTEGGAYRYKLVDGIVAECTAEEITEQEAALQPAPVEEAASVWDEMDGAYQAGYDEGYVEGVNSAYDQ